MMNSLPILVSDKGKNLNDGAAQPQIEQGISITPSEGVDIRSTLERVDSNVFYDLKPRSHDKKDDEYKSNPDKSDGPESHWSPEWFDSNILTVLSSELKAQTYPWNIASLQKRVTELTTNQMYINSLIEKKVFSKYDQLFEGARHAFDIEANLQKLSEGVHQERQQLQSYRDEVVKKGLHLSRLVLFRQRAMQVVSVLNHIQQLVARDALSQQFLFAGQYKHAAATICALQVGSIRFIYWYILLERRIRAGESIWKVLGFLYQCCIRLAYSVSCSLKLSLMVLNTCMACQRLC